MTTEERNILAVYGLSSQEDRDYGTHWYEIAHKFAKGLSSRYNISLNRACGVLSALSPRNKWQRNLSDAQTLISAFVHNKDLETVKVSTFNTNKQKAIRILEGEPIDQVISSKTAPKTWAFYNNILNPFGDHITIDFHAANICDWEHRSHSITGLKYKSYQQHYLNVAKRLSIPATALQAITWTTWRKHRDSLLKPEESPQI